mmetsp:Transcript_3992/g.6002  ORF Transcript_3992/g.6002 Transcript_3992/m.6002 type:complete len:343 (+) Transcript_3992:3240-4268(+)
MIKIIKDTGKKNEPKRTSGEGPSSGITPGGLKRYGGGENSVGSIVTPGGITELSSRRHEPKVKSSMKNIRHSGGPSENSPAKTVSVPVQIPLPKDESHSQKDTYKQQLIKGPAESQLLQRKPNTPNGLFLPVVTTPNFDNQVRLVGKPLFIPEQRVSMANIEVSPVEVKDNSPAHAEHVLSQSKPKPDREHNMEETPIFSSDLLGLNFTDRVNKFSDVSVSERSRIEEEQERVRVDSLELQRVDARLEKIEREKEELRKLLASVESGESIDPEGLVLDDPEIMGLLTDIQVEERECKEVDSKIKMVDARIAEIKTSLKPEKQFQKETGDDLDEEEELLAFTS